MSWKGTIEIKRAEAQALLAAEIFRADDEHLVDALEAIGYGDNEDLKYYGKNFVIEEED